mgnify:FL=1
MKKAFTMLELVMVIIIIAILSAVFMPNTGANRNAEAATRLLSDIRYAQHLAMVDDKYGLNLNWFQDLWRIRFNPGNNYDILSRLTGPPKTDLFATNPIDGSNMQNINLNTLYGVNLIFSATCSAPVPFNLPNPTISFDHMGRPLIGNVDIYPTAYPNNTLLKADCLITITGGNGPNVVISIRPETGYASMQ